MPPTRSSFLCMAGLLFTVAAPSHAQVTETTDRWRGRTEFGFNGASGNTSFSILTAAAGLNHLDEEVLEFDLSLRYRYGTNDDRVIAHDMEATLKGDYRPESDLSPFVFGTVSRDVIRNVDGRMVGGGGAKWTFYRRGEETKISLSGAAIAEYENYRLEVGSAVAETNTVARWSGRLKFDHTFGSGATYEHVTFWQPRMNRPRDYLIDITNAVTTTLVSNLSLVVSHAYVHDAVPPPGAERDDTRYSVLLRVRF